MKLDGHDTAAMFFREVIRALGDHPDEGLSKSVCWAIVEPLEADYGDQGISLDQLLSGRDPKEVFSKDGLFDELKKALAERVLNAELDDRLEGEAAAGKSNHRNGYSKKTVLTETSKIDIKSHRATGRGASIRS